MPKPATVFDQKVALHTLCSTQELDALPEAALVKAGLLKASAAHPAVDRILDTGHVLATWATTFAPPDVVATNLSKAQVMGFNSNDFQFGLASVLQSATVQTFRLKQEHRKLARRVPVRNFLEHDTGHIDADTSLLPVNEGEEFQYSTGLQLVNSATAKVQSYGRLYSVSREALVNDDIAAIGRLFSNVGAHAARLESRLLHELLASNATLSDSEPMFHADHNNLSTAGAFSATSLQAAMTLLRNQLTPIGEKCDLDAYAVVVPSQYELAARQVIREAGLPIETHVSCWLPDDDWYLLADPLEAPVLGLLHIEGGDAPTVLADKARIETGGVMISAMFITAVVALGRLGAVKVTGS